MSALQNRPLVSVVIPTYNRERTLARSIRSVLSQGYENFELIVVDDASTDGTSEVMASIDDPRISYVRMEKNGGAAAARNHGMRLAKGEFIAFQDSDDEWLADKLEKQVAWAREMGSDRVAVFHVKVVYGRDENRVFGRGRVCCVPQISESERKDNFVEVTGRRNLISPQTLMFSRSLLPDVGYFDPLLRANEDWDFSLRLVRHAKVRFIEEPLVMTYILDDSISTVKRRNVQAMLRIILKLRREGIVDRAVVAQHLGQVGLTVGRLEKPRSASRLVRGALELNPTNWKNWARYALSLSWRLRGG